LNIDQIKKFYNFGGVRIEDDVRITDGGNEVISILPKTIQEIENYINN
jgi:Xaa-Pro dipeptidase